MYEDMTQKQLCEQGIWLEKSGNSMHISEMKSSHIENAIKAIEEGRINAERKCWVPTLKEELRKRNLKKKLSDL